MLLNQRVTFKAALKKNHAFRVPKIVMGQFKLESSEVLKVTVSVVGLMGVRESFLAKIYKDGRILVPALQVALLKNYAETLKDTALEVTLEPA